MKLVIPYKFPSFNEYVNECRKNRYAGANMKRKIQLEIGWYIRSLPKFEKPLKIHFHWIEKNKKRDYDNICYAKKFILDALVEFGKLKDDNRKYVTAFTDTFAEGEKTEVILDIVEVEE